MTGSAAAFDDDATDPRTAPGWVTQLYAFASAACVGSGLFFSSLLLGLVLLAVVTVTMNVDSGRWAARLHHRAARRAGRHLKLGH